MKTDEIFKAWAYGVPLSDVIDRYWTIASLLTALTSQANFYSQQSNTAEKAAALQDLITDAGKIYNRYYDEILIYRKAIDDRSSEKVKV